MKKQRKQYQTPSHPWQANRIKEEATLLKKYGLKNKKEIWKAESKLRNWRSQARKLVALPEAERNKAGVQLFAKLKKLNLLTDKSNIDDILGLTIEQVLDNRLQTQVFKKGLASTAKQARQFIVHGKVLVNGDIISAPSYAIINTDKLELIKGFKPVKRAAKEEVKEPIAKEAIETEK